mmetsp:Transcript_7174/g.21022  ORF Transcript_7174/g.21022 Transcript_7174/m.21022 type:complete len:429 (-) Transcript_7174:638-1924(-)
MLLRFRDTRADCRSRGPRVGLPRPAQIGQACENLTRAWGRPPQPQNWLVASACVPPRGARGGLGGARLGLVPALEAKARREFEKSSSRDGLRRVVVLEARDVGQPRRLDDAPLRRAQALRRRGRARRGLEHGRGAGRGHVRARRGRDETLGPVRGRDVRAQDVRPRTVRRRTGRGLAVGRRVRARAGDQHPAERRRAAVPRDAVVRSAGDAGEGPPDPRAVRRGLAALHRGPVRRGAARVRGRAVFQAAPHRRGALPRPERHAPEDCARGLTDPPRHLHVAPRRHGGLPGRLRPRDGVRPREDAQAAQVVARLRVARGDLDRRVHGEDRRLGLRHRDHVSRGRPRRLRSKDVPRAPLRGCRRRARATSARAVAGTRRLLGSAPRARRREANVRRGRARRARDVARGVADAVPRAHRPALGRLVGAAPR